MATNKPSLRVVGDADKPEKPRRNESPMALFERAMRGASNDEALELAYRIIENLAGRAETAADIGIDSDNRDVENEALVFATAVGDLTNPFSSDGRIRECDRKADDAEKDLKKAAGNRRARLDGKWSSVEQFSYRRNARVTSAHAVERAREQQQSEALAQRADITVERVLIAAWAALEGNPEVHAKDVAIALMPELSNPSLVGRQKIINRVSQVMRKLVADGQLVQHRPENQDWAGRKTCRYALGGAS